MDDRASLGNARLSIPYKECWDQYELTTPKLGCRHNHLAAPFFHLIHCELCTQIASLSQSFSVHGKSEAHASRNASSSLGQSVDARLELGSPSTS